MEIVLLAVGCCLAMAVSLMLLCALRVITRQKDKIGYQAGTIEMQIEHIHELRQMIGELTQELP